MQEFINIFTDFEIFCQQADEFVEKMKKKEEKENGKDFKEVCKMRTGCNIA